MNEKNANTLSRGAFTPHNTLASTDRPSFSQRRDKSPDKSYKPQLEVFAKTPTSADSLSICDLSSSSSLFSYNSRGSFEFGRANRPANLNSPIPFVFGVNSSKSSQKRAIKTNKMVNERSPAKAPLRPVVPNDQPQSQADRSSKSIPQPDLFASRPPPSSVPQFGQPTLPQSPLNRGPPKQSSVFLKPTTRPELHRDEDRPG
jgi:hypothetical protein